MELSAMLFGPDVSAKSSITQKFELALSQKTAAEIAKELIDDPECESLKIGLVEQCQDFITANISSSALCVVVGSAKTGFSLKTLCVENTYRFFDNNSDIDIAIVDSRLFDEIWTQTYQYFCKSYPWQKFSDYQKYFFRGWIRPDKLPYDLDYRNEWFDKITAIRRDIFLDEFPVSAGLYKSLDFLLGYQASSISKIQRVRAVR
jgi:hypothetical protein